MIRARFMIHGLQMQSQRCGMIAITCESDASFDRLRGFARHFDS